MARLTGLNLRNCMKPIKIENYARYQEIVERYSIKGCISNDFIQREAENLILQNALFEFCGNKNAYLLVKKDDFLRAYYYINDFNELLICDDKVIVTEILFRANTGKPTCIIDYLERCGFKQNLIRDLYELRSKNIGIEIPYRLSDDVVIRKAETNNEALFCTNLFNSVFDRFSGDFISEEECEKLLENKQFYVALLNNNLVGALHVSKSANNLYWMDHLAVLQEARGKHIATGLFMKYIEDVVENDATRFSLWTQRQNEASIRMYQKIGFKYLGKSTLSMIKL